MCLADIGFRSGLFVPYPLYLEFNPKNLPQPQELIPFHPKYNVQDWDDAPGAINWPRFVAFLEQIKRTGVLPDTHKSHDHLNETNEVPVEGSIVARWRQVSERIAREQREKHGVRLVWAIVDGFLMYWNKVCSELLLSLSSCVLHAPESCRSV